MVNKYQKIAQRFTLLPRLRFLTLKGTPKGKQREQKIGFVDGILRRFSRNYLIVREKNKAANGYHFHAIFSLEKEFDPLPKSFYKKGVHMHVKKIGDLDSPEYTPLYPTSQEEMWLSLNLDEESTQEDILLAFFVKGETAKQSSRRYVKKKLKHCTSVVGYITKELEAPNQFVNYIYVRNKNNARAGEEE